MRQERIGEKDRSLKINEEPTDFDRLGPRLEQVFKTRAERVVFVKGDPDLDYQTVARAIDIARGAGIDMTDRRRLEAQVEFLRFPLGLRDALLDGARHGLELRRARLHLRRRQKRLDGSDDRRDHAPGHGSHARSSARKPPQS